MHKPFYWGFDSVWSIPRVTLPGRSSVSNRQTDAPSSRPLKNRIIYRHPRGSECDDSCAATAQSTDTDICCASRALPPGFRRGFMPSDCGEEIFNSTRNSLLPAKPIAGSRETAFMHTITRPLARLHPDRLGCLLMPCRF